MSQAAIRHSDLDAGRLPKICAKTGKPAAGLLPTRAQREPNSLREIMPGGRGTTIELPAAERVIRAVKGARARFLGWVAVGLACLVAGILSIKILIPVAVGLLVGGYIEVTWARYRNWVGARVADGEVWITRADPDFCRAAGRIYGESGG